MSDELSCPHRSEHSSCNFEYPERPTFSLGGECGWRMENDECPIYKAVIR